MCCCCCSGRLVIFYSDRRVPHEVLPARSERFALTTWYFAKEEVTRARSKPVSAEEKEQLEEKIRKEMRDMEERFGGKARTNEHLPGAPAATPLPFVAPPLDSDDEAEDGDVREGVRVTAEPESSGAPSDDGEEDEAPPPMSSPRSAGSRGAERASTAAEGGGEVRGSSPVPERAAPTGVVRDGWWELEVRVAPEAAASSYVVEVERGERKVEERREEAAVLRVEGPELLDPLLLPLPPNADLDSCRVKLKKAPTRHLCVRVKLGSNSE